MKRMVFIVMVALTLAYLVLGAVIFHFIERSSEKDAKISFAHDHENFLDAHTCINHAELHAYVLRVLETQGKGVQVASITEKNNTGNTTSIEEELLDTGTNWDIASSILFCLTVMSTIGYGNVTPKTRGGRVFCMFYALTAIPMFATVLLGIGERLQILIKWVRNARPWFKKNPSFDSKFKSIVLLTTGICIIVFIPAAVFANSQDWTYVESLYYAVITLTTVGFGDLVPGYFDKADPGKSKRHSIYRVVLAIWILLGLSWVALILSELSTYFQSKISTVAIETQHHLSNLEGIVKKKANATMDKIITKDKEPDQDSNEELRDIIDDDQHQVVEPQTESEKENFQHRGNYQEHYS